MAELAGRLSLATACCIPPTCRVFSTVSAPVIARRSWLQAVAELAGRLRDFPELARRNPSGFAFSGEAPTRDSAMPTDERLIDLVRRCHERQAQGQAVDVTELCARHPELRPALERLLHFEGGLERWLQTLQEPATQSVPGLAPLPEEEWPRVEGYIVKALLASGGMGAVYRALDTRLHREVALKVIRPDRLSAGLRARFQTEARVVAALDHSHIVQIYEVGEYRTACGDPAPYLAMEYVPGGTLEEQARAPLAPAEAARLVQLLARALAHAHARGVVHRDLKPGNVLLAPPADEPSLNAALGRPKVTDFGLARQEVTGAKLTQEGTVVGTPSYMAPEQAEGLPNVGPPADVYALGVILYRLLAGRLPFASSSLSELLYQIAHVPPPPLEGVPADLGRICASCLEKDPPKRPTAAELATRLEAWLLQGETRALPVARKPRQRGRLVGIAGGVAALLVVAALAVWQPWRRPLVAIPQAGTTGIQGVPEPAGLGVKRLWLECFQVEGGQAHALGTVSGEPEERSQFTLPFATRVFVHAEFTAPAHAFLIAFNANGTEQLLWPVNEQKKPDRGVAPPAVERIKYPDRLGPTGRPVTFLLNDEPRGGLQAFAVVLSPTPLPSYEEWRQGRDLSAWQRMTGFTHPFVTDGKGVYPVLPGKGLVRGSEEELGMGPDLRQLGAALRAGVEGVAVLAVPVEAKP